MAVDIWLEGVRDDTRAILYEEMEVAAPEARRRGVDMNWLELEPSVQPSHEPTAEQILYHDECLAELQRRFHPEKTLDEINEWITNEIREDEREMVEIIAERIRDRRQDYLACRVPQERPALRAAFCLGGTPSPSEVSATGKQTHSDRAPMVHYWYSSEASMLVAHYRPVTHQKRHTCHYRSYVHPKPVAGEL